MEFISRYVSHKPDREGYINYSPEEHHVWQLLYERQRALLPGRACEDFVKGLELLDLTNNQIPQLPDVSKKLKQCTGWEVAPVEALISARDFFELLAHRSFPAATFIRCQEELNYVQEPDIFHELFGHCPLLTNPIYANFLCQYAQKVLTFRESQWPLLQRLFWFTVEFGLIQSEQGLRAYGGGILSSIGETPHSLESNESMRVLFDPVVAFRTPYRIDQLQKVYFVIDSYATLYNLVHQDLSSMMETAKKLGEYPPFFEVDPNNPSIHILAC